MNMLLPIVFLSFGFILGIAVCFISMRGKLRLQSAEGKAQGEVEIAGLKSQLQQLTVRQAEMDRKLQDGQERIATLNETKGKLEAQVEAEKRHGSESREHLKLEF